MDLCLYLTPLEIESLFSETILVNNTVVTSPLSHAYTHCKNTFVLCFIHICVMFVKLQQQKQFTKVVVLNDRKPQP